MSEFIQMNVQQWRMKSREGALTVDEMRAAVECIRRERLGAGAISAASKEKKASTAKSKLPIDSDELLKGLL